MTTDQEISPDYLLGEALYIADDIQVTALGVIGSPAEPTSGVQGVLALYTDVGGIPSALVAQTASTTIGPGVNVIPVVSTASAPAGRYWIMAEFDAIFFICEGGGVSDPVYYVPVTYGSIPATITNPISSGGPSNNVYVVGIQ
jgi:hypothetical protein